MASRETKVKQTKRVDSRKKYVIDIIGALANQKRRELFKAICEKNEPISSSELKEKTKLPAAEVHNHLEVLIRSGLVEKVKERLSINPRTGKPIYRFYTLSKAGSFYWRRFEEFSEDVDRLLPYFGYAVGNPEKAYGSGVRLRFRILQEINRSENGLTPSELLKKLKKFVSSPATLSHHLSKLEKVLYCVRDRTDRRRIRYRIRRDVPSELLYLLTFSAQ